MRIIIITISIILLKVAVAVYSAYRYLLLVCTMLLFAVTVALAGHSTRMAIFSALRMVAQATSPLPEGNNYSSSNRRRYDNSRGTSISIKHRNGKCMSNMNSNSKNWCLIGKCNILFLISFDIL